MLINQSNIKCYIPQREPFIMIDSLVSANNQGFESEFEIKAENIFLEQGILSESALIENIAQTCAAGFGFVGSQNETEKAKLGFIGAISKLVVENQAKLHDVIQTKIEFISTFDSIHLIEGTATCKNQKLLSCQMKIVVT